MKNKINPMSDFFKGHPLDQQHHRKKCKLTQGSHPNLTWMDFPPLSQGSMMVQILPSDSSPCSLNIFTKQINCVEHPQSIPVCRTGFWTKVKDKLGSSRLVQLYPHPYSCLTKITKQHMIFDITLSYLLKRGLDCTHYPIDQEEFYKTVRYID